MRCHHGTGLNDRVTLNLGLLFQGALNPDCRQTKGRVGRLLTRQRACGGARVNRQPAAGVRITAADFHPFHQDAVARGREIHIVPDVDHRRQEAHILGEFFTNAADTAKQLTILLEIHHRDQAVPHFHPQRIFELYVVPGGFHRLGVLRHFDRRRLCFRLRFPATHPPGKPQQRSGEQQEYQVWHARHHTEQAQHRRGEQHNARVAEELPHHLLAHVLIGTDASHNHARRGGDHKRRDLRHQTVTNGQQRIAFRRVAHVHAVLQHADEQAADDVNHHDQNARDGVTAHKLTRTVHGAIEICLLGHFGTAFFRFIFRDQPGIQVGVDGHLLARHPVEHEARAHFSDTPRPFSDNHEVDNHQNDEHHDTDGEVAAHQEVTEGFDHLARRRRAGVPFHQDDTRGGNVQRQAQQRGEQQDRWKRGELQRALGEHRHQQHHDGQRNVEGEKQVEDKCR